MDSLSCNDITIVVKTTAYAPFPKNDVIRYSIVKSSNTGNSTLLGSFTHAVRFAVFFCMYMAATAMVFSLEAVYSSGSTKYVRPACNGDTVCRSVPFYSAFWKRFIYR